MKHNKNSGFNKVALIVIFLAIIITIGVVGWQLYNINKSKTTNQTQAPANQDSNYIVIKDWNVRFRPADGLNGLIYFKPTNLDDNTLTFTTNDLASTSSDCQASSGNIILGLLTRSNTPSIAEGAIGKIGSYYYQYTGPQAACSPNYQTESETALLLSQSLKSLEGIKQ